MRIAVSLPLLLIAAAVPAHAAGGGGASSSTKPANRYQASWHLAVPSSSTTGETVVVFRDGRSLAADGHAPAGGDHAAAGADTAADHAPADAAVQSADAARMVDLPIVVAPLVVDGELRNYAFVTMQVDVLPGHDPWKVREQAAYLRDAMVRAAHAQPVNPPGDPGSVDPEAAVRVWSTAAEQVLGPGVIGGMRLVGADVRYPDLVGGE